MKPTRGQFFNVLFGGSSAIAAVKALPTVPPNISPNISSLVAGIVDRRSLNSLDSYSLGMGDFKPGRFEVPYRCTFGKGDFMGREIQ